MRFARLYELRRREWWQADFVSRAGRAPHLSRELLTGHITLDAIGPGDAAWYAEQDGRDQLSCAVTAWRRAAHSLWRSTEPWSLGLLVRGLLPHVADQTLYQRTVIMTLAGPAHYCGHHHRPPPRTAILATEPGLRCHCQLRCGAALARRGPRRARIQRRRHLPDGAANPQGLSDSDPRLNRAAYDAGSAAPGPTRTFIFRPPASDPQAWSNSSSRSPRDERGHRRSRPLQGSIGRGSPWSTRRRRPR